MRRFRNRFFFIFIICSLLLSSVLTLFIFSFRNSKNTNSGNGYVFDCDTGLDDARALVLALDNNLPIKGIICTQGNTSIENAVRNTLWVLKETNNLSIPIFYGLTNECVSDNFFGNDGFSDIDLSIINDNDYKNVHKTQRELESFLRDKNYNLISTAPKTTAVRYLKYFNRIYSMGGAVYVQGDHLNDDGTYMEFNQYGDQKAYDILMKSNKVKYNIFQDDCLFKDSSDWKNRFRKIDESFRNILYRLLDAQTDIPGVTQVLFADELVITSIVGFINK